MDEDFASVSSPSETGLGEGLVREAVLTMTLRETKFTQE